MNILDDVGVSKNFNSEVN